MKALFCLYSAPLIESALSSSTPLAGNLCRGRVQGQQKKGGREQKPPSHMDMPFARAGVWLKASPCAASTNGWCSKRRQGMPPALVSCPVQAQQAEETLQRREGSKW